MPEGVAIPAAPAGVIKVKARTVDPVFGKGIGLMRTFNTDWHNEDSNLSEIMGSGVSLSEKVVALRSVPFLQDKFAAFEQAVRSHAGRHHESSPGVDESFTRL